ncbi:hypothetical protein J6590_003843 [Homalodisca vitripennis]|nr:hypothetical protein J6590_003843 [Homalodisca vitripennis]
MGMLLDFGMKLHLGEITPVPVQEQSNGAATREPRSESPGLGTKVEVSAFNKLERIAADRHMCRRPRHPSQPSPVLAIYWGYLSSRRSLSNLSQSWSLST